MSRLDDLRELRDYLRELIRAEHTEHGLQGLSGLVGQYQKCIADIEAIEKNEAPAPEGTGLDEFTRRLAERQTPGSDRASKRRQSR